MKPTTSKFHNIPDSFFSFSICFFASVSFLITTVMESTRCPCTCVCVNDCVWISYAISQSQGNHSTTAYLPRVNYHNQHLSWEILSHTYRGEEWVFLSDFCPEIKCFLCSLPEKGHFYFRSWLSMKWRDCFAFIVQEEPVWWLGVMFTHTSNELLMRADASSTLVEIWWAKYCIRGTFSDSYFAIVCVEQSIRFDFLPQHSS